MNPGQRIWDKLNSLFPRIFKAVAILFGIRMVVSVLEQSPLRLSILLPDFLFDIPILGALINILLDRLIDNPLDLLWELTLLFGFYVIGSYIAASVIFPTQDFRGRWDGLWHLFAVDILGMSLPVILGKNGSFDVRGTQEKQVQGPGIVIIDPQTALVLEKDNNFARVIGPGLHRLEAGETVHSGVDLRPQAMQRRVTAVTREGIELEADLSVAVELARPEGWQAESGQYGWTADGVFRAIYAEAADADGASSSPRAERSATRWCDAIASLAVDGVRQFIARYTLDQLFAIDNPDLDPRTQIVAELRAFLEAPVERYGARLRQLGIGNIRPPHAVLRQRVENWHADWEKRQVLVDAAAEARRQQEAAAARALGQAELLQSLARSLGSIDRETAPDLILMRLAEAIERMGVDQEVRNQLTPEQQAVLDRLRQLWRTSFDP